MSDFSSNINKENSNIKRDHHNATERQRRGDLKHSFEHLRDVVNTAQGSQKSASRIQILRNTAHHIQDMHQKISSRKEAVDDLNRQNRLLEEQIRMLMEQAGDLFGQDDLASMQ